MSTEAATPGQGGPWPVLDLEERRVLGVLVEKSKTTPDAYPMSLNGLVTGCNQKSNRDPIMELEEDDVEEALQRCKARQLVVKVTTATGRVEKWKHLLYDAWRVDSQDMAVLAELLLRGPQTEGELRTRASRMAPIEDLDKLRSILEPLVARNLIVYLTPKDRRGAVLTHGFHEPGELQRLRAQLEKGSTSAASGPASVPHSVRSEERAPGLEAKVETLREELTRTRADLDASRQRVSALEQIVGELRSSLSGLQAELATLRQSLGG